MRRAVTILPLVIVFAMLSGGACAEGTYAGVRLGQLGEDEAVEMLVSLQAENQRLLSQVSNLTEQVAMLEVKIAEFRIQSDLKSLERPESGRLDRGNVAMVDPSRIEILEVNREMRVAVVTGGARAGMKIGMKFSVLRDGDILADVRITEVRDVMAGGLIEWNGKKPFPEVGDRLILRSMQDG